MSFILYALLAWFLYQFIFKFVIPIYRATRQVKRGFREMQRRQDEQVRNEQTPPKSNGFGGKHTAPKGRAEDYIEFEEIK